MSLVAYDADSDSDNSDQEEDNDVEQQTSVGAAFTKKNKEAVIDDNISDEEDFTGQDGDTDFFDVKEPDLLSLISEKLPNAKLKSLNPSFVDEAEDVSSIPEKKDYGSKPEEPPAKKKKRQGPVQIVLPALSKLEDEEEEKKPRIQPSKSGSGLFSLLPAPKNSFTRKMSNSVLQSQSVSKTPALSETPNENNLKPQGVRKVGLVPHRVANPVKQQTVKTVEKSDSEDDEDYLNVNSASSSYFPESSSLVRPAMVGASMNINPVPGAHSSAPMPMPGPAYPPSHQEELLGPAVAPYPPPAPSYPGPGIISIPNPFPFPYLKFFYVQFIDQHIDNDDAMTRLAGKQNKLREMKEDPNMKIVDVNEDDMRGDPRVWLTKAMTEEKAPRPTGKGPKGLARSRHQITYLAHQAKERDWELRQEWATARENKRASANKYGF